MTDSHALNTIDLAIVPLGDGRRAIFPLLALAEVSQISAEDRDAEKFGTLHWRGHDLPVSSLDEFLGLPAADLARHSTIGVFRAAADSPQPFRALAFCGLAAHQCVEAQQLTTAEIPEEGYFSAAVGLDGETLLVPDIADRMYGAQAATH